MKQNLDAAEPTTQETTISIDSAAVEPAAEETTSNVDSATVASSSENIEDADMSAKDAMVRAVKQVEFYFSDANLPYDKFMWRLHISNSDHWVPIETITSFSRMREYQSLGNESIVTALRRSEKLDVDEDGTKVRRREDVREETGHLERSIYVARFGEESDNLQIELERFFSKYGEINALRMRRYDDTKKFKGSVFVEFADSESVQAIRHADPKPCWNGQELMIMSKEAYINSKVEKSGIGPKAAALRKRSLADPGHKGFNAFRQSEKAGSNDGNDKRSGGDEDMRNRVIFMNFMGARIRVHEGQDGGFIKTEEVPFVRGASLKFENCGKDISFSEIKDVLKKHFGRAPFIKYSKGDSSGLVGFDRALEEEDIRQVQERLPTLCGTKVIWSLLDEETEQTFQAERAQSSAQRAFWSQKWVRKQKLERNDDAFTGKKQEYTMEPTHSNVAIPGHNAAISGQGTLAMQNQIAEAETSVSASVRADS